MLTKLVPQEVLQAEIATSRHFSKALEEGFLQLSSIVLTENYILKILRGQSRKDRKQNDKARANATPVQMSI